jgi:hypothetical protein
MTPVRRLLVLAVFALLFTGGWVLGRTQTNFSEDGPGWRAAPEDARLFFVDGYSQGFRNGRVSDMSDWNVRLIRATGAHQITTKQWSDIQAWKIDPPSSLADKMLWAGWATTKITTGEIEEGVNRFYAESANQGICWGEAFTIVSNSLAGVTFSDVEVGSIRSTAAKNGCD